MIYGKQFNIFVFYVIAYFMTKCFAVVEYDRPLRPKSQRCLYSKELAGFARDSGSNMRYKLSRDKLCHVESMKELPLI